MADKKPPAPAAVKYTVLPPNHPLLATFKKNNAAALQGAQSASVSDGSQSLPSRSVAQVRLVEGHPPAEVKQHQQQQVFVRHPQVGGVQPQTVVVGNGVPQQQRSVVAAASLPVGQVIRLPAGQKSIMVGGQQVRLVQEGGGKLVPAPPPSLTQLQPGAPLQARLGSSVPGIQPRLVQVRHPRVQYQPQQTQLVRVAQPAVMQQAGQRVALKQSALGPNLQNQIIRTPDGQQFVVRRSSVIPSSSGGSPVVVARAQIPTTARVCAAPGGATIRGAVSLASAPMGAATVRSVVWRGAEGGGGRRTEGSTYKIISNSSLPPGVQLSVQPRLSGHQQIVRSSHSSGQPTIRSYLTPSAGQGFRSPPSSSSSVGQIALAAPTHHQANQIRNRNNAAPFSLVSTAQLAPQTVTVTPPGGAQLHADKTLQDSHHHLLATGSSTATATSTPVNAGRTIVSGDLVRADGIGVVKRPAPQPTLIQSDGGARKVFIASEVGGQKVIKLDARSLASLQGESEESRIPMARIISRSINAAPEIRISAPDVRVAGKDIRDPNIRVSAQDLRMVAQDLRLSNSSESTERSQPSSLQRILVTNPPSTVIVPSSASGLSKLHQSANDKQSPLVTSHLDSLNISPVTSTPLLPSPARSVPQSSILVSAGHAMKSPGLSSPPKAKNVLKSANSNTSAVNYVQGVPSSRTDPTSSYKALTPQTMPLKKRLTAPTTTEQNDQFRSPLQNDQFRSPPQNDQFRSPPQNDQFRSPQKFDGFRLVSQDGRVLGGDTALQGLQLLSAEGNLIRADELPVISDKPVAAATAAGGANKSSPATKLTSPRKPTLALHNKTSVTSPHMHHPITQVAAVLQSPKQSVLLQSPPKGVMRSPSQFSASSSPSRGGGETCSTSSPTASNAFISSHSRPAPHFAQEQVHIVGQESGYSTNHITSSHHRQLDSSPSSSPLNLKKPSPFYLPISVPNSPLNKANPTLTATARSPSPLNLTTQSARSRLQFQSMSGVAPPDPSNLIPVNLADIKTGLKSGIKSGLFKPPMTSSPATVGGGKAGKGGAGKGGGRGRQVKEGKGRGRSRPKESLKAKMQKLENALNLQHLVNQLENKAGEFDDEELLEYLEIKFLDILEEEVAGAQLSKEKLDACKQYYAIHRPRKRFIDISNREPQVKSEDDDERLQGLLSRHVKLKRYRLQTCNGAPQKKQGKEMKGKLKGRATKTEKLTPQELKQIERHKLWTNITKKEIGKGTKARNYNFKEKQATCKRLATACMRAQRSKASASQKIMKENIYRAKRIAREIQSYWKKSEKEEKQLKRAKEKVEQEQRRQDIELIEAKRQQRKLNFLITQTELYAHFMAGKIGQKSEQTEKSILSKLDSDIKEERIRELDYYDEGATKAAAREAAETAAKRQEAVKNSYSMDGLRMSEAAETAGDRPQPAMFQGTLKSYQLKGMNWLCSLYDQGINGILADEMGLGKTVQSLAFLGYVAETYGIWGPFLVITPASTLHNWQQELQRFLPEMKTIPYWGSPGERKVLRGFWSQSNLHTKDAGFHVVITSYQIIVSDLKYFNKHAWQYMILDEAQAIKSANSQRWKMLLEFKCRGRLLLSGTPIQNTMAELWSLLHFVMPALFDSHDEFKEWFSKDIESHADGSRSKVDEKQMGRLHLILKPFMLRRIKKDVEHELTDKVEVLLYCPLTIRQRLLYDGLKTNIRMEELLAGLGLGSGASGVSSLMNLVMQFRKVCNHPELFERREPRSPLVFTIPPLRLPRLVLLDPPSRPAERNQFSIFRADRVHRALTVQNHQHRKQQHQENKHQQLRQNQDQEHQQQNQQQQQQKQRLQEERVERLEVADTAFDFLKIVDTSPGELEQAVLSLYQRWLLLARVTARQLEEAYSSTNNTMLRLGRKPIGHDLIFTGYNSRFLSHCDELIESMPETISHRIIRSRHLNSQKTMQDGSVPLVSELHHIPRPVRLRPCVPTSCPGFLLNFPAKVAAIPHHHISVSSRTVAYRHDDHVRVWTGPGVAATGKLTLLHGEEECSQQPLHYSPAPPKGLLACSPNYGWSNIVIPDKLSLISDAGKLFVLDGLLRRLKEEGHRVLIYSQMTKMIDLLEEFMSHRQHSYMRLDGSSKIHERRDMVADFQNRQDIFVFLLSTRAGGLGINLTAADTVIFYDSDWNPTVDQQAMDRAHRLGQTKQVTVYRLICKGTIEERILQRAREKSEIHRLVIQGGSFKGKSADLKPKEVVSLLLEDDEMEKKVKEKVDQLQPEDVDQKPGKRKRKPNPEAVPGTKANAPRQSPAKTPPTPNSEAGESHKMKKLSSSKTALPNGDLIKGNQTFGFYKQS